MSTNPYQSPETDGTESRRPQEAGLWLRSACSLAASLCSLGLFYLYTYWHWYTLYHGPWGESFPGQLGLSWLVAVDGSKACSVVLAIVSLIFTAGLFNRKATLQGMLTLPTCVLSLLACLVVT